MQTTTLLTAEDISLVKQFRKQRQTSITSLLIVGPALILLTVIIAALQFHHRRVWPLIPIGIVTGIAITIAGVILRIRYVRNNTQFPAGGMKEVITDTLLHVEMTELRKVRYQFNQQYINLHIPLPYTGQQSPYSFERSITNATALTNTPVTLSYIKYAPGVLLLLSIDYPQSAYRETVEAALPEDRKTVISRNTQQLAGIVVLSVVAGVVISLINRSIASFLVLAIGIPAVTFLLEIKTILFRNPAASRALSKIVIRADIAEVLDVNRQGKGEPRTLHYYRIGNGLLVHIPETNFAVGDSIQLQFLEGEHNTRGQLIDIVKL